MRACLIVALCAFLGGCAASTTDAVVSSPSEPIVRSYPANYQEIYRRVSSAAKSCFTQSTGPYSQMRVDSELFSELGYGEIAAYSQVYASKSNYWTARVDRDGKGAKLTVKAPNTIPADQTSDVVLRWASGDTKC